MRKRRHIPFTDPDMERSWKNGYMTGLNARKRVTKQEANMDVELFRVALMKAHADDWSMETISEAAHICADAVLTAVKEQA